MKGFVGKFIIVLVALGLFSFLYTALNEAYAPLYTWATGEITDSDSLNAVAILNEMWLWFPIGVIFSYMLYSIRKSQRTKEVWP